MYRRNHRFVKLVLSQIEIQTHKEVIEIEGTSIEHSILRRISVHNLFMLILVH